MNLIRLNAGNERNHMETRTESALDRAVQYLNAVEVAPGRVAVKDGGRYLVIDTADAPGLAFEFENGEPHPDACAQVTEMPASWNPGDPIPENNSHA